MRTTPSKSIFSPSYIAVISRRLLPLLSGVAVLCFVAAAQETAPAPATPPPAKPKIVLPDGEGKDIVSSKCNVCHTLTRIVTSARSQDEWHDLVQTMIERGADVSPDEADTVVKYLSKNFPPKDSAGGGAAAGSPSAGDSSGAPAPGGATAGAAPAVTGSATPSAGSGQAPAASASLNASAPPAASGAGVSASAKVNLNTATDQELKSALGLSDKEAGSIVKYRAENGSFKNWEDLEKVQGLDKKTIDVIKDRAVL